MCIDTQESLATRALIRCICLRWEQDGLGGCLEALIYNNFYSLNEVCISSLLEALTSNDRDREKRSSFIRLGLAQ